MISEQELREYINYLLIERKGHTTSANDVFLHLRRYGVRLSANRKQRVTSIIKSLGYEVKRVRSATFYIGCAIDKRCIL